MASSSNIENNALGPEGGLPRIKRSRERDMLFTNNHHLVLSQSSYDRRHDARTRRFPSKPTTAAFKPHTVTPARKRTMMEMVLHRSGAMEVKDNIARIAHICEEYKNKTGNSTDPDDECLPPHTECSVLLYLAHDAYYQVIIAKYGGIPAILDAMNTFLICADFQACCCEILCALCAENSNNKAVIEKAGGSVAIMTTMRNNPRAIRVQTSGCAALRELMLSAPPRGVEVSAPTPKGIGSSNNTTKATITSSNTTNLSQLELATKQIHLPESGQGKIDKYKPTTILPEPDYYELEGAKKARSGAAA